MSYSQYGQEWQGPSGQQPPPWSEQTPPGGPPAGQPSPPGQRPPQGAGPPAGGRSPRAAGEQSVEDNPLLGFMRVLKILVFFVYLVIMAVLVILVLGFVLRLFGASTDAEFTRWVYRNDQRAMEPFRGMFPSETVGNRSVVDFSLLFGMIFYAIVALVIHGVVTWLSMKVERLRRGESLDS